MSESQRQHRRYTSPMSTKILAILLLVVTHSLLPVEGKTSHFTIPRVAKRFGRAQDQSRLTQLVDVFVGTAQNSNPGECHQQELL